MLMGGDDPGDAVSLQFFSDGVPVLTVDYAYSDEAQR